MSELHETAALADRIDRLEAQTERLRGDASRMKLLATVACAALVAVTAVGATAVTHSASPLAFTDTKGQTRLRLDSGGVHVFDAAGRERILIGFNTKGQPAIHINDKYGTERESLYLDSAQNPNFTQYDKNQNERAQLYVSDTDGTPQISLDAADGTTRFYVHASDVPYLTFGDKGYNQRAYFGLTTEGSGLMRMRDQSGKEVVSIEGQLQPFLRMSEAGTERAYFGVNTGDEGELEFSYPSGTKNVVLQGGDAPIADLYNSYGTAIWAVP